MQEHSPVKKHKNLCLNLLLVWVVIYQLHYYLFGDIDYFRFYRLGFPAFNIGLLPGTTLVELLFGLMLSINLYYSLNRWILHQHEKLLPRKIKFLIAWFFTSAVLATILGSLNEGFRFVLTELRYSIFFLLFVWYAFNAIQKPEDLKKFFQVFNIGSTVLSIAASISILSKGTIILPFFQLLNNSHLGFDYQYIILLSGMYFLFGLIYRGDSFFRVAGLINFIPVLRVAGLINFIPVILNFEKTIIIPAFVALFIVCIIVIVKEKSIIRKIKISVGTITFILAIFISITIFVDKQIIVDKIEKRYLKGGYFTDTSVIMGNIWGGRLDLWRFAFSDFLDSPLYGHGFGYQVDVPWFEEVLRPHNLYIRYLATFGLFGFIPFLILILLFLSWNIIQLKIYYKKNSDGLVTAITLFTYILSQLILMVVGDTASRRPYVAVLLYISMGLLMKYHIIHKNTGNGEIIVNVT